MSNSFCRRFSTVLLVICIFAHHVVGQSDPSDCVRSQHGGLQAYYDFQSAEGPIVKDRSGVGKPVDLKIRDMQAVRRSPGELEILEETRIQSLASATKISESVRRSGEITIEAWIRPANIKQKGPARIVSLSRDGSARNFTLGQDRDRYDLRLRTSSTSENGIPSLKSKSKSLTTELTYVVYTRDRDGTAKFYINGKRSKEKSIPGSTSNWTETLRLALANEQNGNRAWLGTYYLVAIYNRDFTTAEVENYFQIGLEGRQPPPTSTTYAQDEKSHQFETKIAPLIAKHCLECHDPNTKDGDLNLAHRSKAFLGGDSGEAIVPGNAEESYLWQLVDADEMPQDRPPLTAQEKQLLREWIDSSATWSLEKIDPAVYAHDGGSHEIWLQRLTVDEYIETVRSAVGIDIAKEANELLPPDLRADGFSNTAYNLSVDLEHIEAYAKLAEIIVSRMNVLEYASEFADTSDFNEDNIRKLITRMGKWLLRGPLEDHDIDAFQQVATTVANRGGTYEEAISYLLQAMLQSPRFIYRLENQRGDGSTWPANDYELASRLSYILWGGPPDKELMRAADAGEFFDCRNIEAQVDRMLKDQRTQQRSLQFVRQWLNLGRLKNLQPNAEHYPNWNKQLADDMQAETEAYFLEVVWNQNRPLVDLLNAQVTFLTPRLAEHYGIDAQGDSLSQYDVSSTPSRGGILTQGSILTVGGDEASMVGRGLFILHDILRGVVKAPPPTVDPTPVPTEPGLTQRIISDRRTSDPLCGGCHAKIEPLAFGLEIFDGLGTFQNQDRHGNPMRQDGEILIPGEEESLSYQTAAELMDLLANSERVSESITWKVTQFALGRPLVATDARYVQKIHKKAQANGGTYASLLKAIVMSELVQMTRTETN